ncbi:MULTISPECIES: thermonuclease family protein [unclassified Rhizobium]|uniref:thermonuclease family protein n=1 Tax=Rhizobium sp. PP-CC-3G-465 TaxID=2135648 RepID=UPI001FDFD491
MALWTGRRAGAKNTGVAMLVAIVTGAAFTGLSLCLGVPASNAMASPLSPDRLSAEFSICGESRRVNCVVDGDTFWFQRRKIRIADIDAPELSPPRCEDERAKGEAAKRRLLDLLNGGRFSITAKGRDEDRYRRELRVVTRNGRSIGDLLVEDNLARRWDGRRRPWCG